MKPIAGLLLAVTFALAAELALVQPKDLAAQLASRKDSPLLLHVGFNVMYRGRHIPGSVYAGPGGKPEGLEALKTVVKDVPKNRDIVIYCGCCPWDHCPNIKPAFETLRQMGYTHVRALYIPTNIKADWIDRGYPVE